MDWRLLKLTWGMRWFGWRKIPVIGFVRPRVIRMDDERIEVKIPLCRRTRNHLRSMYFGVLAIGADLAGGFLAMRRIVESGQPVSLVFKDIQGRFLKRAEGDVTFVCEDGAAIDHLVQQAIETGERVEMPVHIRAMVPDKLGDEPAATFTLTLSLKKSA